MTNRQAYIKQLLNFLCQQSRVAGSDWNLIVNHALIARLQSMRYQVEVQEVEFTGWRLIENPSVEILNPIHQKIDECLPVVWSNSIEGFLDGVVFADELSIPDRILTFDAYPWIRFPVHRSDKTLGAYLIGGPRIWPQTLNDMQENFPYIMIPPDAANFLVKNQKKGISVQVRIAVNSEYLPGRTLHNLVAKSGPSPSILVGAHFDSFFNTVGAHDNASGTATLLCLAGEMADSHNPDIAFVCFDGEEFNKLGSKSFVRQLGTAGKLDQVRWMINIDSVGYGDSIYVNIPGQGTESLAEYLLSLKKTLRLNRTLHIIKSQDLQPFDAWPFVQAGIPAIQIGTFGEPDFPYWHHPMDNPDGFNESAYDLMADVVMLAKGLLDHLAR